MADPSKVRTPDIEPGGMGQDPTRVRTPDITPGGLGGHRPPQRGSGQVSPFDEFADMSDWPAIRKAARWFDLGRQITLAGDAVRTEIVAAETSAGELAIIRFFANGVGSASDAPFVTFAVLLDESPIAGYESILGPKSPALTVPDPMVIGMQSRQRVSVVATNSSASAVSNVGARLKGFYWVPMMRGK